MKAIVCTRYGPPEVLQIQEVGQPEPGKNQVCVRIAATAVTSSDCYIRGLDFPAAYRVLARLALGLTAPRRRVLGMVLAGEVTAAGPDARSFAVGDRVFGIDRRVFGTYAEFVCWADSAVLAPQPANLTAEEAAALPFGGLLALHFLNKAGVSKGDRVLVYGASGAVGTSAVQLASCFGAMVTGVCSTANLDLVASLGAVAAIDYTKEEFATRAQSFDVIFDAVGKRANPATKQTGQRALAPGGRWVSVDDGIPTLDIQGLLLLKRLAESGDLRPVIDRRYRLDEVADAHAYVGMGHKKGNVVVTVPGAESAPTAPTA